MNLLEKYKVVRDLKISGATIDCADEVFYILQEYFGCPSDLLNRDDFMLTVLEASEDLVFSIDWGLGGISHDEWWQIAEEIAPQFDLELDL